MVGRQPTIRHDCNKYESVIFICTLYLCLAKFRISGNIFFSKYEHRRLITFNFIIYAAFHLMYKHKVTLSIQVESGSYYFIYRRLIIF